MDSDGRAASTWTLAGGVVCALAAGVLAAEVLAAVAGRIPMPRPVVAGLCVAALAGVRRLRRSARRVVPEPSLSLVELTGGDDDLLVDAVVTSLEEALRAGGVPLALHLGDDVVEVFWSGPPPRTTRGFVAASTGWVWTAGAKTLRSAVAARRRRPCADVLPALVPVGASGFGALWLNLEALQVAQLVGEHAPVRTSADHLLGVLAGRPVDRAVIGRPPGDEGGSTAGLAEAVGRVRRHRMAVRRLLEEHRLPSVAAVRLNADPGVSAPLVVLIDEDEEPGGPLDPLVLAASGARSGTTCLVCGDRQLNADVRRILCTPGAIHLDFLGDLEIAIVPEAARPGATSQSAPASAAAPTGLTTVDHGGPVMVRLLGPVLVDGARAPLGAKGTELVSYLALHPDGVSDERVKEALWPAAPVRDKTLHNRMWAARQALGHDANGEPVLPHFVDGIGRLASSVRTDVEVLEVAFRTADAGDAAALAELRDALDLVRGRPFDERSGYEWAFTELHVAHAERVAVDAAHRLASAALEAGDGPLTCWAAERGLAVVPTAEILVQDQMHGFAVQHDYQGVDRVFANHVAAMGTDDVSEETRELHDALRRPTADTLGRWERPT